MNQTQEQTKPRQIVLEDGVFRPGNEFSSKTIDERIEPDALTMVSSVYLGPRNYTETERLTLSRDEYDARQLSRDAMRNAAIQRALGIAMNMGVPYFSVSFWTQEVKQPIDLDQSEKPTLEYNIMHNNPLKEGTIKDMFGHKEGRKVEYALHPTAQFYVPRTRQEGE